MNNENFDEELIQIDDVIVTKDEIRKAFMKELENLKKELAGKHYKPIEKNVNIAIDLYNKILEIFGGDCKVTGRLFFPTLSTGQICVIGDSIVLTKEFWNNIPEIVREIEIIPTDDEQVSIELGIYDLAKPE